MTSNLAFSNMINGLVEKAFQKIVRYDCDYQKQLAELENHRQSAVKVNDLLLEGRTLSVIGILNSTFGYLDKAQTNFYEALEIYRRIEKWDRVVSVYINLTRASSTMGEYERALKFSAEGLALPYIKDHPAEYAGLLSNRLVALMATEQYAEAERCIAQLNTVVDQSTASNPQYYARVMTHVYRDDAELTLYHKKFDASRSKVNLGLELAQSLDLRLELAELYFTSAHIALAETPTDKKAIDGYFAKAEEIVRTLESPVMLANCLLAEANLLKRQRYTSKSNEYAMQAAAIFQVQGLTNALERAKRLL